VPGSDSGYGLGWDSRAAIVAARAGSALLGLRQDCHGACRKGCGCAAGRLERLETMRRYVDLANKRGHVMTY
jgi:hypothetical protein